MKSIRRTSQKQKLLISCSIIPIILYLISIFSYFLGGMIVLSTNNNRSAKQWTDNIGLAPYLMSTPLLLFSFTVRLDVTFMATKYQYSKITMKILYSIAIFLLLLVSFLVANQLMDHPIGKPWSTIFGFLWLLTYWIFSFILIILFTRKVNVLLIETANAYNISIEKEIEMNNNNKEEKEKEKENEEEEEKEKEETVTMYSMTSITKKKDIDTENDYESVVTCEHIESMLDNKLLDNMIKNSILVPLALVSSMVFMIVSWIMANFVGLYRTDIIYYSQIFINSAIDVTINSFSLYCLFSFNQRQYFRFCSSLHRCCQLRKLKKMKNSNEILQVINKLLEKQEHQQSLRKEDTPINIPESEEVNPSKFETVTNVN